MPPPWLAAWKKHFIYIQIIGRAKPRKLMGKDKGSLVSEGKKKRWKAITHHIPSPTDSLMPRQPLSDSKLRSQPLSSRPRLYC